MKKIYVLGTCTTCTRILKELDIENKGFEIQDIKTNSITKKQIEEMFAISGSYDTLFSRRAMKYKSMGLKDKNLSEEDYKNLILEEYTFLKRPVAIIGEEIYIGNSKKVVEALGNKINE